MNNYREHFVVDDIHYPTFNNLTGIHDFHYQENRYDTPKGEVVFDTNTHNKRVLISYAGNNIYVEQQNEANASKAVRFINRYLKEKGRTR